MPKSPPGIFFKNLGRVRSLTREAKNPYSYNKLAHIFNIPTKINRRVACLFSGALFEDAV